MDKISGIVKPSTRVTWKSDIPAKPERLTDPREALGLDLSMPTTSVVAKSAVERIKEDPDGVLRQPIPMEGKGLRLDTLA